MLLQEQHTRLLSKSKSQELSQALFIWEAYIGKTRFQDCPEHGCCLCAVPDTSFVNAEIASCLSFSMVLSTSDDEELLFCDVTVLA